ncbi:MAG: ribosome small subunit-dependent GTPase A [Oscillospiraceae bacterium]|nr:ribosome small subunit-dependent GTPase A [Oscillospiraceae bacterium]
MNGLILDSLGGIFTVETEEGTVEAKARGVFRNKGLTPVAGDRCVVEEGLITELLPRKNSLIRPPLANLDVCVFVVSTTEPAPDMLLLDKFIAVCEYKDIAPCIALTKVDLKENPLIPEVYRRAGIPAVICDYETGGGIAEIKKLVRGKICAFTGNTGVGKSTLLNHLAPQLSLETSHISRKLGRGRHTTRVSRLYPLFGGYVADTPGFSTFDTMQYAVIHKEELAMCFREFDQFTGKCRFSDCTHTKEKGCEIIAAVEAGEIAKSRHDSYVTMFEEAKRIKDWEI